MLAVHKGALKRDDVFVLELVKDLHFIQKLFRVAISILRVQLLHRHRVNHVQPSNVHGAEPARAQLPPVTLMVLLYADTVNGDIPGRVRGRTYAHATSPTEVVANKAVIVRHLLVSVVVQSAGLVHGVHDLLFVSDHHNVPGVIPRIVGRPVIPLHQPTLQSKCIATDLEQNGTVPADSKTEVADFDDSAIRLRAQLLRVLL
mmetsp:Transcript_42835/g.76847  ORF Transcript_42835/g.76847 Transcript_42835/m.76847 type:complete len:202 (+) Transcript_42835:714-1319(+)